MCHMSLARQPLLIQMAASFNLSYDLSTPVFTHLKWQLNYISICLVSALIYCAMARTKHIFHN